MKTKNVALVVGIDSYERFPKLGCCTGDARDLANLLRSFCSVKTLRTGSADNRNLPNKGNIDRELRAACKKCEEEVIDSLIVYLSGHGDRRLYYYYRIDKRYEPIEGEFVSPMFLAADSTLKFIKYKEGDSKEREIHGIDESTAIPIADVIRQMNASPARQKILILDACYVGVKVDDLANDLSQLFRDATGSPGSHKTNDDHTKVADEGKKRYGGYALFHDSEGFAMLAASTGSQVSREAVALKHGYFTYHLLNGLGGKALRDNKPFITVTDIALYTAQQLRNMSWGEGFQEPTSLMAMKGDMILVESQAFEPDYRPLIVPRKMDFRRNVRFTSRDENLETLRSVYRIKEAHVSTEEGKKFTAITGMGGIGKSQLAAEFIYQHERDFPGGVFWLNFADSGKEVENEIAKCGSNYYMNLPGWDKLSAKDQVKAVLEVWCDSSPNAPRRLLVFDNCEEESLLKEYYEKLKGSRCSILVTSRHHHWEAISDEEPIRLGFGEGLFNSVEFLKKFSDFNNQDETLRQIAEKVGHLPLALHLVGSVLSYRDDVRGITPPAPKNYLAEIEKNSLVFIKLKGTEKGRSGQGGPGGEYDLPTGHIASIGMTFEPSYNLLLPREGKSTDKIDELALHLLFRAAFFAPSLIIPRNILEESLVTIPEEVKQYPQGSKESKEVISKALERLVNLGLVDWGQSTENQEYGRSIILHRLVVEFLQARPNKPDLDEQEAKEKDKEAEEKDKKAAGEAEAEAADKLRKEAEELRKAAAKDLEAAQTDVERAMYEAARTLGEVEDLSGAMKIQAHLRHIVDAAMKREQKSEWAVGLCAEISIYLYIVGDSKGAEPYFVHAEKACDERIEQNDSSDYIVGIADCLAMILREYNVNLKKSCKYQRYTVDKRPDNNEYRSCLSNVLGRLGEYSEALKWVKKVLESLDKDWDRDDNPDLRGNSDLALGLRGAYNSLFLILYWRGEYTEAFKIIKRLKVALFTFEEPNINDTESLAVARNLASVAMMIGGENYDIAQEMLNTAQVIQKDIYGDGAKNRNIAMFYHLRGKILRLQERIEDFDSAKEDLIRAYEMNVELVQILDAATDLNELALLLKEMEGEFPQARAYAERALNIREAELGFDHPLVTESLYALAAILYKQGSSVDARIIAERALKTCEKKKLEEHYVVKALRKLKTDLGS